MKGAEPNLKIVCSVSWQTGPL